MNTQQAFFEALLDPRQSAPSGLCAWNGSDPAVRFAVYRNNVLVSLVDALADTYPVAQELVGEPFFRAMARLFVRQEPPRSRVLAFYGESFPTFIENFAPAASVPYLADVARLELLRVRAYHAADGAALPADALAQALAQPDTLAELVLGLHPSVGLLRSRYAVVSLWAAHQGVGALSDVDPALPENALLVRPGLEVELLRLDAGASALVAALQQGTPLGPAAAQASQADADFDLASSVALLIRTHALSSITHPDGSQACIHPPQ
ncbi:MAG: DUF2063 domain-containing protein [Burkholderiales bacterium RIFCSPLOWO2_12_FULL_61_40]|nr:MAG: DUF2063 domain-containing protein [Burkholderiales bacterium RIFCSPLOWO2_12_FULL_61_40]